MNNLPIPPTNAMTPQIHFKGVPARPSLNAWLRTGLHELQGMTLITAAEVRLERLPEASPPMQAQVHLAIAGPDIHATVRDHTIQAVWHKVLKNLKGQIVRRKAKVRGRHKGSQLVRQPESRHPPSPAQRC